MPAAGFDELDTRTLYRILRLRSEVFVVEQRCCFLDLDGRDMEPDAIHVWADPDPTAATVGAALRVVHARDGSRRIGRVVSAPGRRGVGLGAAVVDEALSLVPPDAALILDAQAHLESWYERWGFVRTGVDFLEDGIPHVPMRRAPTR